MNIEIKHLSPESQKIEAEKRKRSELEKKFHGGPTLLTLVIAIVTLCSPLLQYYALSKLFYTNFTVYIYFAIGMLSVAISYRNLRASRYGNSRYRIIVYVISILSISISSLLITIGTAFVIGLKNMF